MAFVAGLYCPSKTGRLAAVNNNVNCAARAATKRGREEKFDEVAARAAEVKEVIDGLLKFKQRIIDDTTALAKKVKAPPKNLKEALAKHPDILKIDQSVIELEAELEDLGYTKK